MNFPIFVANSKVSELLSPLRRHILTVSKHMKKYTFYLLISLLIFGCSSINKRRNKNHSEKELESSLLVGDFIFVGDTIRNAKSKKKIINKTEPKFNPNIDKDSLFQILIKKEDPTRIKELTKAYKEGNVQTKEFLLLMLSIEKSSKKELIENLKKNENNIKTLISEYSKLVPDSLIVFIEFNPKNIILSTDKSIDLRIYSKKKDDNNKTQLIFQERDLSHNSKVLLEHIKILGWNNETLKYIKTLLDNAKCISIKNGETSTVGFKRSGMGKYSYIFFKKDLNKEEQKLYNDGCLQIFYERNIVLEYGGGAFGQQCFEKN